MSDAVLLDDRNGHGQPTTGPQNGYHAHALGPSCIEAVTRRLDAMPPGNQSELVESLVIGLRELTSMLRDTNTSWSVERSRLMDDVREIRAKVEEVPVIKHDLDALQEFITGGDKDRHLGERFRELHLKVENLETESRRSRDDRLQSKKEAKRAVWAVVGIGAALLPILFEAIFRFVGFLQHVAK